MDSWIYFVASLLWIISNETWTTSRTCVCMLLHFDLESLISESYFFRCEFLMFMKSMMILIFFFGSPLVFLRSFFFYACFFCGWFFLWQFFRLFWLCFFDSVFSSLILLLFFRTIIFHLRSKLWFFFSLCSKDYALSESEQSKSEQNWICLSVLFWNLWSFISLLQFIQIPKQ